MKLRLSVLAVMAATPALVNAAALDRSGQSIAPFFEKGNYAELSYVHTKPDIPGESLAGSIDGSASEAYGYAGAALKFAPNDSTSVAIFYDEPWGVDYDYAGTVPAALAPSLGKARAKVSSENITTLVGGKVASNFWLYGGLAYEGLTAEVGQAAGTVGFQDSGIGYVGGFAYTIPDIALRASVTYRSAVEIDNPSASVASFETPQNVNIEFQTGINPTTLLMLDARWVNWKSFDVNTTPAAGSQDLAQYDGDQVSVDLGLGRKITDDFSGLIKLGYDTGAGDLISVFGPYKEVMTVAIGGKYNFSKNVDASLGVAYSQLGEAEVPGLAKFEDAEAVSVGGKLGFHF